MVLHAHFSLDRAPDLLALKLEPLILQELRRCWVLNKKVQLLVKNGEYFIETDQVTYSLKDQENNKNSQSDSSGTVVLKGNVLEGTFKRIHQVEQVHLKISKELGRSSYKVSKDFCKFEELDSQSEIETKFLAISSLGPATKLALETQLNRDVSDLISKFSQKYDPKDNFLANDVYPVEISDGEGPLYILKDKCYKDIRPWALPYSEKDRELVLGNTNNALTRLGFLSTHPLRKKINDRNHQENSSTAPLVGGLLKTKKSLKRTAVDAEGSRKRSSLITPLSSSAESSASSPEEDKSPKISPRISPRERRDLPRELNLREKKEFRSRPASPVIKQQEVHKNLAFKFKQRYKEYLDLYRSLQNGSRSTRKDLVKLYELHNTLSNWKEKLWTFDLGNQVMNLTKHRKDKLAPPPSFTKTSVKSPSVLDY